MAIEYFVGVSIRYKKTAMNGENNEFAQSNRTVTSKCC